MKPAGFTLKSLHANKDEVESLRQQLNSVHIGLDAAIESNNEQIAQIELLEQQLAECQAALALKDEALREVRDDFDHDNDSHRYGTTCRCCLAEKALAIQPGTEALEKWLGEPIGTVSIVLVPDGIIGGVRYKADPSSYLGAAFFGPVAHGDPLYAKPKGLK